MAVLPDSRCPPELEQFEFGFSVLTYKQEDQIKKIKCGVEKIIADLVFPSLKSIQKKSGLAKADLIYFSIHVRYNHS